MRASTSGLILALFLTPLVACSGGDGAATVLHGTTADFPDPHHDGAARALQVAEVTWGRLVDVHRLTAAGNVDPVPLWRDYVIHEQVGDEEGRRRLETTLAGRERLVLLTPDSTVARAWALDAAADLPRLEATGIDALGRLPMVPRNATLMVRFDDLLDDGAAAQRSLADMVRLTTGGEEAWDVPARIFFDPNHGGTADDVVHATRILVDPTIGELESGDADILLDASPAGLPEGEGDRGFVLRLATRSDVASGHARVLTALDGAPLGTSGPVDAQSPTYDMVRAFRAGTDDDVNHGYLHDSVPPEVVGAWPTMIDAAAVDPSGMAGRDFLVDASFLTVCQAAPRVEDVLLVAQTHFLEVTAPGTYDPGSGTVTDLHVHLLGAHPVDPAALLGHARHLVRYDPTSPVDLGCWIGLRPHPRDVPLDEVSPDAKVIVRFSEPIAGRSVRPYDSFRVVRGDSSGTPTAVDYVVGDITPSRHHRQFTFHPTLPLAHYGGADPYHVEVVAGPDGIVDLAGNPLAIPLPPIDFTIDPTAPIEDNGGIVLRFADADEYQVGAAAGADDLRGQYVPDFGAETIRARPVTRFSAPVDRTNPVPSVMTPFPSGVQTPLTPFGAKLNTVWRYCDLGWTVLDESYVNLDVEGLSWSPVNGQVVADHYSEFEILLAHSVQLPDESLNPALLLPNYPDSGLFGPPQPFDSNILGDPSDQAVVHPRALGYTVNPADLYLNANGTPMMPFPLNRGSVPATTYTWRDTAILHEGAYNGGGIPTPVEELLGIDGPAGSIAAPGSVPSIGLPLLLEYRCYPSDSGLGLNGFDVSLAINSSARPNFRIYSAGGVNSAGQVILKNPDLELVPSGGFNPGSFPPGAPSLPTDNVFYLGQADFVVRVNRVHSVWFDTGASTPSFRSPIVETIAGGLPSGTEAKVEFRAAFGFLGDRDAPFDAAQLDAYGDPLGAEAIYPPGGGPEWTDDVSALVPAAYVQLRITLLGDIDTLEVPELSTLALAFTR